MSDLGKRFTFRSLFGMPVICFGFRCGYIASDPRESDPTYNLGWGSLLGTKGAYAVSFPLLKEVRRYWAFSEGLASECRVCPVCLLLKSICQAFRQCFEYCCAISWVCLGLGFRVSDIALTTSRVASGCNARGFSRQRHRASAS